MINSTTFTFWQNQFQEASGTNTFASGNATDVYLFRQDMMRLWMNCTRGTDQPDLIVSSQDFYNAFWGGLVPNQRYTSDDKEATMGFNSLRFQQADVIFDRESTNFSSTAEKMYFLNSDYLELNVHRDANWTTLDEKMSLNQDAVVIPIIWQGQLTVSNRARQGILIDAS